MCHFHRRAVFLPSLFSFLLLLLALTETASSEPLALPDVLRLALAENPRIAAWEAQVRAGEGGVTSSRAYPNPELGGKLGRVTRFDPGKNEGSVELSQLLEVPAKRKYRRQAAEMDLKAMKFEREAHMLNFVFEVKQTFYAFLLAQKQVEVARDNERSAQTLLASAKVRVEVGEAPEYEQIKAQVEVARATNEMQKAASRVALARADLNLLMGRPASSPLQIEGTLESAPQEYNLELLLQRALENHPSLQQQRSFLERQSRLLDMAKASRYPDLTVSGFYDRETDKELVGMGLSLPLPLWDHRRGEILTASSEKARAEAELSLLQQSTGRMVNEAFQNYMLAKDLVQVFTQQLLKQAEESRRIAEISYREGASGILDFIEAQRTYRQTLLEYEQALYELKVAEAGLEQAIGGGSL